MLPPLTYAGVHDMVMSLSILEVHGHSQRATLNLNEILAAPDTPVETAAPRATLWQDPETLFPNHIRAGIAREKELWASMARGSLPEKFNALNSLRMLYLRHRHSGGFLGLNILANVRRGLTETVVRENLFWELVAPNLNGFDCLYLTDELKKPRLLNFPPHAAQPPALFEPGAATNAANCWAYVHVDHIAMIQDIVCTDCVEAASDNLKKGELYQPVVIALDYRSGTYYLKDGYHRLFAARQLGATYVLGRVNFPSTPVTPFQSPDSVRFVSHAEHMERINSAGNLRGFNDGDEFESNGVSW